MFWQRESRRPSKFPLYKNASTLRFFLSGKNLKLFRLYFDILLLSKLFVFPGPFSSFCGLLSNGGCLDLCFCKQTDQPIKQSTKPTASPPRPEKNKTTTKKTEFHLSDHLFLHRFSIFGQLNGAQGSQQATVGGRHVEDGGQQHGDPHRTSGPSGQWSRWGWLRKPDILGTKSLEVVYLKMLL